MSEEAELVKNSIEGDKTAFSQLMRLYSRRLYSYVRRSCGAQNADDVLQEVLINVWKGIPKYNETNKFSGWLFTIAHNTIIDHLRKSKQKQIFEPCVEGIRNGETYLNYETKEIEKIILHAVETLPEKQKQVFLLRIHGKLKFREIAEITNENLNTVLSNMSYAVKKLRNELEGINEK